MEQTKMIKTLSILGESIRKWGENAEKEEFNPFVAGEFYEKMENAIIKAKAHNGWFSEDFVRESLTNLGSVLTEKQLAEWSNTYSFVKKPKKVGLILAGNIPMVGFHDVLSTLFSGNIALIKLSRDDDQLIPILLEILIALQPEIEAQIQLVETLNNCEAVIATGSDNTARYFEKYFGHLPRIIRKNRTSVAVLTGNESKEELIALGKDVFDYYGLGCRNVSHLILPKNYDLNLIFGAIVDYGTVVYNNKYGNNYDYYKAIFLMNEEKIIENGFVLLRETKELFSPIAVLHYHFYENQQDLDEYLTEHQEKIQIIVGSDYVPFGTSQCPGLTDYADGVDSMKFLSNL